MKFLFIFIGAFSLLPAGAQTPYETPYFADRSRIEKIRSTKSLVDRLFNEHARKSRFPGFVYGVIADGQLIYSGGTGFSDVEKKIAASPKTVFRIASMSKSFTALAILKLRDEGKLRLDDPASLYIPEMKSIRYLTADAPVITIRHLLTHAAGFPEDNPWGDRQLADSDQELMDLIKKVSFSNPPGIAYEYSNLGFALLGRIITIVAGKPYQQYIRDVIIQPLGMHDTYWEYGKVPPEKLAHGYRLVDGSWKEESLLHDGAYGAMGGLLTSIEDFSRYMEMHLDAWPPKNDKENGIVKRSTLREMHQPSNFSGIQTAFRYASGRSCVLSSAYGFGLRWAVDCEGKIFVGHSGGLPGFGSNWNSLPDYGIGVVCFSNLTYGSTGGINLSVLDTIIKTAGLERRVIPPSSLLENSQKELVRLLPDWPLATKSTFFAENFFMDYSVDSLRKEAGVLFAKAGKIKRIHPVAAQNNLRGTFVLEGENTTLEVFFTLTPEDPPLIQEYHIREIKK